jgi:hypothetical protein
MADTTENATPAPEPIDEKFVITSEEEYEKAMAKASSSENPALYKSKVDAAYAEYQAKEAEKAEGEKAAPEKGSAAALTGASAPKAKAHK